MFVFFKIQFCYLLNLKSFIISICYYLINFFTLMKHKSWNFYITTQSFTPLIKSLTPVAIKITSPFTISSILYFLLKLFIPNFLALIFPHHLKPIFLVFDHHSKIKLLPREHLLVRRQCYNKCHFLGFFR